jgi:FlaG/FlaF family flagellin (archaellin)
MLARCGCAGSAITATRCAVAVVVMLARAVVRWAQEIYQSAGPRTAVVAGASHRQA